MSHVYKKSTIIKSGTKRGEKVTQSLNTRKDKLVDNELLYNMIKEFQTKYDCNGKLNPTLYNNIAQCIYNIAEVTSLRPQFRNYTFRQDMVNNAVIQALTYLHTFNADKFNNPVSWCIQTSYFVFISMIKEEKKALYTKLKSSANFYDNYNQMLSEQSIIDDDFSMDFETLSHNDNVKSTLKDIKRWCNEYEKSTGVIKEEVRRQKLPDGISDLSGSISLLSMLGGSEMNMKNPKELL